MPTSYADFRDIVERKLQDSTNAEFAVADINDEIEDALKEYGSYQLHEVRVPVVFQIESRFGSVSATSSSNLTDTSKSQFVSGDATNEKVVHNTTDDTWAVVASFTSSSVLALNKDIFVSGEQYEIYNKRCWNKRQIYIGDVTDWIRIAGVEYHIGRPRDFTYHGQGVLEIDAAFIADSDPTLSTLSKIDVLVWFAKPHILSQLTDWEGEASAAASAGATTLAVDGLGATELIEEGEVFTIENHRSYYTITTDVTTSANAATLTFYPALEAAVSDNDDITFIKSSLQANDYDNLAELVAGRLLTYKAPKFIRTIAIGGRSTASDYRQTGREMLAAFRLKMRGQTRARTTLHYSRL